MSYRVEIGKERERSWLPVCVVDLTLSSTASAEGALRSSEDRSPRRSGMLRHSLCTRGTHAYAVPGGAERATEDLREVVAYALA